MQSRGLHSGHTPVEVTDKGCYAKGGSLGHPKEAGASVVLPLSTSFRDADGIFPPHAASQHPSAKGKAPTPYGLSLPGETGSKAGESRNNRTCVHLRAETRAHG